MLNLIISIFSFLVVPKNVILHLEKIPDGITHTGVSFQTPFKTRRYDFRAFNENCTCMTTGLDRMDPRVIFPNIYEEDFDPKTKEYLEEFFTQKPEIIPLDIFLGTTQKTFEEIEMYSGLRKLIRVNFKSTLKILLDPLKTIDILISLASQRPRIASFRVQMHSIQII